METFYSKLQATALPCSHPPRMLLRTGITPNTVRDSMPGYKKMHARNSKWQG